MSTGKRAGEGEGKPKRTKRTRTRTCTRQEKKMERPSGSSRWEVVGSKLLVVGSRQ